MIQSASRNLFSFVEHREKLRDQLFVPEASLRFGTHRDCGVFVAKCRLIGTRGTESIVDVRYLQDARQQRDFACSQTVGVSAAVGVLVVMANDWQHEAQRL